MNFSSVSQIAMFILSILMIVLFIKPTFSEIKTIQNTIFEYDVTMNRIADLNNVLQGLINEIQSIRQSDMVTLETYLPSEFDELKVMSDISTIAEISNVTVTQIVSAAESENGKEVQFEDQLIEPENVAHHDFTVSVSGTYDNFKEFLTNIENNKYIIEVASLQIGEAVNAGNGGAGDTVTTDSNDFSVFDMVLRTYVLSHTPGSMTETVADDDLLDPLI